MMRTFSEQKRVMTTHAQLVPSRNLVANNTRRPSFMSTCQVFRNRRHAVSGEDDWTQ